MTIATDSSVGTDKVRSADTWVATKLRYLLEVNPATPVELRAQSDRLVPFIPMEALGEDGSLDTTRERPVAELLTGYSYFANGDVLMAKVTPCFENGKAALMQSLSRKHGFGSTEITTLRAREGLDPAFLHYLVRSDHFRQASIASMTGAGGLKRVPDEHIRSFETLVPPETEQREITNFLDRETAKIDSLIDKQEQLIATLREDRAATITQAITKGLDQSVEMHRTGIAVMDAIPSHWSVRKLKHLVERFEQGVSPQASAELATEGWGVLKSGCVNGGVFRDIEHKKLPRDFEFDGRLAVAVGDLLVCRASGSSNLVGSAAIVQEIRYQLILSDKIFRLTPSGGSLLGYLEWAMNARPYREQVLGAISGAEGLANNLPLSSLRNFWFAVPPIAEQQEIARFLGERCTKIDLLIAKSTAMIETLREYRSALITNAVTGKIDVREAV